MAVKIRCQQCRKKISIDEAFAGGLCRCPYCKAITLAPGRGDSAAGGARPDRPDLPAAEVPQPVHVETAEAVPLARPVMVQGIVALILSGFLLLLVAFGVVLFLRMRSGPAKPDRPAVRPDGQVNGTGIPADDGPATVPIVNGQVVEKGPRVVGMAITPPVVYVLDASSGMREMFDPAVAVVRLSIRTMTGKDQFSVIVVREEGIETLADGWVAGGEAGDAKMKDFVAAYQPAGATDLAEGLRRAVASSPKTVVVLSGKAASDADGIVQQAGSLGVRIFVVGLGAGPDAAKAMEKLAEQTGGRCRQFTDSEIMDWLAKVPPLP